MGNKHYELRATPAADQWADLRAALLDYYGAYDADTNPDGVQIDYDTSPCLIFRCSAIADKYIRAYVFSSVMWSYGDGVSGNDVTNPVRFGGTNNGGGATAAHLVLGPHTLLYQVLQDQTRSRLILIGQMTNGDYAVFCAAGSSTTQLHAGCAGFNTTDGVALYPVTFSTGFQSADGKLYTQRLILRQGVTGVELNGDGSIASFQDVYNAAFVTTNTGYVWGATFVLTTSQMFMDPALPVLPTCLLMEYDAEA